MSFSVPTGQITLEGGEIIKPPTIHTSQNGWIYKPNEAKTKYEIQSGKGKAWPRKTALEDSRSWLRDWIERQVVSRDYPTITHIERPVEDPVSYRFRQATKGSILRSDVLGLSYRDPVWGWVSFAATIKREAEGLFEIDYRVGVHEFLYRLVKDEWNKLELSNYPQPGIFTIPTPPKSKEGVQQRIAKFIKDPFEVVITPAVPSTLGKYLTPPEVFPPLELPASSDTDHVYGDEQYASWYSGRGHLWPAKAVEDILLSPEAWKTVTDLFDALSFVGYDIRGDFGYSYGDGRPVRSLTIELPPDTKTQRRTKPTNLHGHTIKLNASQGSIDIDCGYVHDEQRWLEYEKRKAQALYSELERDLRVEEWEIDLTGKEE